MTTARAHKVKPAKTNSAKASNYPKSTYLLRDIDPTLWREFKSKAALEGVTVAVAVKRLLEEWVHA